jgi:hypothetical protein
VILCFVAIPSFLEAYHQHCQKKNLPKPSVEAGLWHHIHLIGGGCISIGRLHFALREMDGKSDESADGVADEKRRDN